MRYNNIVIKLLFAAALAVSMIFYGGTSEMEMEKVNGSFLRTLSGEITTPAPYTALIKDRAEFSRFLSDRRLFFDGRFAFYEKYEGGNFFEEHDLIAVIVKGEHELKSLEQDGNTWLVALKHLEGENHTMYFINVEKIDGMTDSKIV